MKTLIAASIFVLASGTAMADWEDVWQNPDLSNNFDGYMETHDTRASDPLELAYDNNGDLYSGGDADVFSGAGATSYDLFVRGNPDVDVCGCI